MLHHTLCTWNILKQFNPLILTASFIKGTWRSRKAIYFTNPSVSYTRLPQDLYQVMGHNIGGFSSWAMQISYPAAVRYYTYDISYLIALSLALLVDYRIA